MSYQTTQFVDKQILTHDDMNNIIMGIDESQKFDWKGKTIAFWGDSVTAAGNGDFEYPYTGQSTWQTLVGQYFQCSKLYVRGVGGQTFKWVTSGSVTFVDSTGNMVSRNDSYTYDNYEGNVEVPDGCVAVRGCGCSYLRISTMFPEAIRNDIDCVFMIYHNDASVSTKGQTVSWIAKDKTDPEWAASEYYATYGGDYNIATTAGAIASTIMKMQALLPNAVIVLGTPCGGRGTTGALNPGQTSSENYNVELKDLVLAVGSQFGVPVIDVFGTSGINGLNRNQYIYDGIHPNKYGNAMLAKAVIGGLKGILPLTYTNRKPDTITGAITIAHRTVSAYQGVDGFVAGQKYNFKLKPNYTGSLTLYYGYPNRTQANGFDVTTSPTAFSGSCTANTELTGTFTIPTTLNASNKEIEIIVIRTHTDNKVTVEYEFTKVT